MPNFSKFFNVSISSMENIDIIHKNLLKFSGVNNC